MMYKILIVEDEPLAVKKLKRLIDELGENFEIIATLDSNQQLLDFLATEPAIDVIFSDIELIDGPVFQTYQQITPQCPVIFVTAYNQYMMDAFESSGIAYLLKPFNLKKLEQAWHKFIRLTASMESPDTDRITTNEHSTLSQLNSLLASMNTLQNYTERFAIKSPDHIYFLDVGNIAYIQADGGVISAFDTNNKRHFLPFSSLQKLDEQLNPAHFFRLNRSEYVQQAHIEKLERYSKNSLMVYLKSPAKTLITSQSRTAAFTKWLGI